MRKRWVNTNRGEPARPRAGGATSGNHNGLGLKEAWSALSGLVFVVFGSQGVALG